MRAVGRQSPVQWAVLSDGPAHRKKTKTEEGGPSSKDSRCQRPPCEWAQLLGAASFCRVFDAPGLTHRLVPEGSGRSWWSVKWFVGHQRGPVDCIATQGAHGSCSGRRGFSELVLGVWSRAALEGQAGGRQANIRREEV